MVLNGRKQIMAFLGRPNTLQGWRITVERYGNIIRRLPNRTLVALSEELAHAVKVGSVPLTEDGRTDIGAAARRREGRLKALGYRVEVRSKPLRSAPVPEPISNSAVRPPTD